jgi:hypothetical protein
MGQTMNKDADPKKTLRVLEWVFFASGIAALLYQMIWQRTLFVIYGINIESVTMIVTTFMVGLGVGSLAGGALSRDPRRPVALRFAIAEAGIGLYGLFSQQLFHWIGAATGALAGGFVFLTLFGQQGTLRLAAAITFGASAFAFYTWRRSRPNEATT